MIPSHASVHGSKSSAVPHASPTVFIVDDDESARGSLEALICGAGWHAKIFASALEFLAHPRVIAPSCLVLGVALLSGLDLQRRIAADRIGMPIICITGNDSIPMAVQAMKAGAAEYFMKPCRSDLLLEAIRASIERSQAAMRQEAQTQAIRDRYASLSCREKEVMALVVSGRLNKTVGMELGISEITVKAHRGRAMEKMNAGSLADLVNKARVLFPETDTLSMS
jgi:FixJ family two-component response regulator